jgi:hypothetical protein
MKALLALLTVTLMACGSETTSETTAPEPEPTFPYPLDDVLRVHHIQTKSTHNSYHLEPDGNTLLDWAYTHVPLDQQLDAQGVRHFELDLRRSADGRFEVIHLPIIDEQTSCRRFVDCLQAIKGWSDTHRAHHLVVVQLELKDTHPGPGAEAYFEALHAEMESVWPRQRIFTPDELRGDHANLRDALAADGWPTLGTVRGHVMFTFDNTSEFRDSYLAGSADLSGRLVFPASSPDDPFAAIAVINDPVGGADAIAAAVAAGMLVRTRADSGSVEAEAGDTSRLEAALASGAHFISTDHPAAGPRFDYWVEIPGGTPSRCNPSTAPGDCSASSLEEPSFFD